MRSVISINSYLFLFMILPLLATVSYAGCDDPAGAGVDWSGCVKIGVYLKDKNLNGADLSGANLRQANFEGANLSNADLSETVLLGSNLQGANLEGANVKGAYLTKSLIAGIKLKGAVLDGTYWINGQKCLEKSIGECRL